MTFDRKFFFDSVRDSLFDGGLDEMQAEGCSALLDGWEKIKPTADKRFVAYSFATDFHETARTMQPIREIGEGRGQDYGKPAGPWKQIYYGRGLVQLTWLAGYLKANQRLHVLGILTAAQNLAQTPDLALEMDIAVPILIAGLTEGWFTGKSLSSYAAAKSTNWIGMRRTVNGLDCAAEIAGYAQKFLPALKEAA